MKTLLIVYHSMTGATEQMARAVACGAAHESDVAVRLRHASHAAVHDVLGADAFVFATPENLAGMAGLMKDFFDRCYYGALDRLNGRSYACVVCAGSDGTNAARQIERIATGWRLRAIAAPLIISTHTSSVEEILAEKALATPDLSRGKELGATLATGLAIGAY
jgi:multimeric flavodoxin WrbA